MGLITCKDCQKEFSTDAKQCPHCGADRPKAKTGCIPVAVAALLVLFLISVVGSYASPCNKEWNQCADNGDLVKHYEGMVEAKMMCEEAAAKQAKYGDPKFPQSDFGTFYQGDNYVKTGIVILLEPHAQFQNGFGAMVHMTVTCSFDLNQKKVISAGMVEN
jgi:hypothetical protein